LIIAKKKKKVKEATKYDTLARYSLAAMSRSVLNVSDHSCRAPRTFAAVFRKGPVAATRGRGLTNFSNMNALNKLIAGI
jgi:hypothetical protein